MLERRAVCDGASGHGLHPGQAAAAREIALAFGVPPMLLGLPGDNTYSNYAEANRSFWRQTVIPLVTRTAASLAHWLAPAFDGVLRLEPDLDGVDALAPEREALWARIGAAGFLTDDEKREAVGYGARPASARPGAGKGGWGGLDSLPGDVVASPAGGDGLGGGGGGSWQNQPRVPAGNPDGGQWTDGGGVISGGEGADSLAGGNEVDLLTEEETNPGRRSHPVTKHVGMSQAEIAATVEQDSVVILGMRASPVVGSFRDIDAANRYVNETILANRDLVTRVINGDFGKRARAIINLYEDSTGLEGYSVSSGSVQYRATNAVRVVIQRDNSSRGYRVITAFPFNLSK